MKTLSENLLTGIVTPPAEQIACAFAHLGKLGVVAGSNQFGLLQLPLEKSPLRVNWYWGDLLLSRLYTPRLFDKLFGNKALSFQQ